MTDSRRLRPRWLAAAQAAYYIPTALAPFVSRRAFESVTGRKHDWWLVLAVGTLVGVDGAVLAAASVRAALTSEIKALGIGSAVGLAAIDVVYSARRQIPLTYLLDATMQLGLISGCIMAREEQSMSGASSSRSSAGFPISSDGCGLPRREEQQ